MYNELCYFSSSNCVIKHQEAENKGGQPISENKRMAGRNAEGNI